MDIIYNATQSGISLIAPKILVKGKFFMKLTLKRRLIIGVLLMCLFGTWQALGQTDNDEILDLKRTSNTLRLRGRHQDFQNLKNNLIGNIWDSYPIVVGDIFVVPEFMFIAVDHEQTWNSHTYLITLPPSGLMPKAIIVKTTRELSLFNYSYNYFINEALLLECIGTATYKRDRVTTVDTWIFRKIN
jgi:hypothetical protein